MSTAQTSAERLIDRGVVGSRHLVGIQMFDISRLTNHAIPIVPGTFVAVSGRGPKLDSNGSGKTTFLAAVTLLLADPQWRLETNGGKWAAGILFKPDAAGIDPNQQYPAASYGYIVGVFANQVDHLAPDGAVLNPLTVWVRIATTTPYVEARWAEGLCVVDADSDLERFAQAETIWASFPTTNRSSARRMAEVLYGAAPRCLSYLDTPLRPAAPSLLSQQMTELTPDRIGESLIALAGLTDKLEEEEKQRAAVADHQRRLADAEAEDARIRADEDADLSAVAAREEARQRLAEGEHLWRLHFAKGYLEVIDKDSEAATLVDEAAQEATESTEHAREAWEKWRALRARTDLREAADTAYDQYKQAQARREELQKEQGRLTDELSRLANERTGLAPILESWSGATVEQAEEALKNAHTKRAEADVQLETTRSRYDEAEKALRRVQEGRGGDAGRALDLLAAVGISAAGVLDAIEFDPSARAVWEPRLSLHQHAVAVAPEDERAALEALTGTPGIELVIADGHLDEAVSDLPGGVRCSVPLGGFLHALADRHPYLPMPDRAADPGLGSAVLGGFTTEIAGRAARLARAQAELGAATTERTEAENKLRLAELHVTAAKDDLDAAKAAARLAEIQRREEQIRTRIPALDSELAARRRAEELAEKAWATATAAAENHANQVQTAQLTARLYDNQAEQARKKERQARRDREELRLPYWRDGWGSTVEAARTFLDEETDQVRKLRPDTMRIRAADALRDALRAYGVTSADTAPEDLADVIRRREQLAEGSGGVARDSVDFSTLARPLRIRLDGHRETDRITQNRVLTQRRTRELALAELRREVSERAGTLERLQDMIEQIIEQNLHEVGQAFDRLDIARGGYGAALKVTSIRPDSPTSHWRWQAVPCWRRAPTGGMVSYREVANGAQVKVHAIQLVLAALLATGDAAGRVLVLDELGNSLGDVNKRDVLGSLKQVAEQQQVTILGTCQDSVLEAAAEACGAVLWFTHISDAVAYNQPTRAWAHDLDGNRVELTAAWMRSGRGHV